MAENNSSDLVAHKNTYDSFVKLLKWSTIALVALMVFLYVVVNP